MHREAFFSWCVSKRNLKKNSIKHTRIRYDLFYKWLGRRKLNYNIVAEYKLYLIEKGLQNPSVNSHLRVIRLIDIYEREFHTDLNLFKMIDYMPKTKRIPVILSREEQKKILSVKVDYAKRFQQEGWEIDLNRNLLLWVITATGCRSDEGRSLRKCDIILGLDNGFIKIQGREDFSVKNDVNHKVPIPMVVIEKLRSFLEKRKPTELAFQTAAGNKLSSTSIEEDWKKRLKLAGITSNPHIHDLRASFIMEHIRKKTPFPEISSLVGHKDIQTTFGYAAFNDEDINEAASNHYLFEESQTDLQRTEKMVVEFEKIRKELEYNGNFLTEERRFILSELLQKAIQVLHNQRLTLSG